MTLLINEIHIFDNLQNSFIASVADQRLTRDGKYDSTQQKLFKIPYLNAGVGYFGLAQVNSREYFSSWLPNFIKMNSEVETPGQFAERLRDALNRTVNKSLLRRNISGLHICGYNAENFPEFWIVRNSDTFVDGAYRNLKTEYYCAEEFLARDAKEHGFNNITTVVKGYQYRFYINGDIRPFHHIWGPLGQFLKGMFVYEDFKQPKTPEEYVEVAKWKVRVIASFYKQYAKQEIIGAPIDGFPLLPEMVKQ
jgi:hypothetical protein